MLHIRGVNVFPANVEEAVRSIGEFGDEYILKVVEDDKGLPDLVVKVEVRPEVPKEDHERLVKQLQEKMWDKCQIRVTVIILPFNTLPRTEFKAKRILNLDRS